MMQRFYYLTNDKYLVRAKSKKAMRKLLLEGYRLTTRKEFYSYARV